MRNIVVTGGGTGIGYAIAEAFVAQGDRVVLTGRRRAVLDEAVRRLGGAADAVAFDAADPAAVAEAANSLPTTVDVLVNNAGGNTDFAAPPGDDLVSVADRWRANLAANVLTAVLVTTALADRIPEGGRVVTIGSIAAHQGAGAYGAAKAAVEAWNAGLSARLGPRRITANVVAPGLVTGTEFFRGRLTDQRARSLVAATHTQRAGVPVDIAALVLFLASPQAIHVTGQVLHANGGAFLGR
ncbi:MAG TPA: SDR family oxidoreductase [Pilimelia sp.]|nr:SDR family oxidoreductase [Pilimelia sp.]